MRTLVVNALRMSGKRTAIGRHLEYLAHHWSKIQGPFDKIVFMSPGQTINDLILRYCENLGKKCSGAFWVGTDGMATTVEM